MSENDLKEILLAGLGDCKLELELEGNKLFLRAVGDVFEGLNRVKRSQLVYALLDEKISSGELHAVSMKCLTLAEASE